ncbi:50S ribosomal protein L18e [Candidatus Woesearchaeota archaeon]|nr:50S ribosomal protein L18e [Candidatus Woesearchaeota archaeon]
MKSNKSNIQLVKLVEELRKQGSVEQVNLWKALANELDGSTRHRRVVNIYKLNQHTKPEDTVVVPGKVLSVGEIDHKINVAAFNFSALAKEKILKAHGNTLSIDELMKLNPKGKGIKIIG